MALELTVDVAKARIQVDLGVVPSFDIGLEYGLENVAVLNADVLGRLLERHCDVS